MSAPFAALQTRVNDAVARHLADATADFGGGLVVDGLFDAPHAAVFGGLVSGTRPGFSAPAAELTGILPGAAVTIGGVAYAVAERQPDGAGWLRLDLDEAA